MTSCHTLTTGLELERLPGESNLNSTRPKIPLISRETASSPAKLIFGCHRPPLHLSWVGGGFFDQPSPRYCRPLSLPPAPFSSPAQYVSLGPSPPFPVSSRSRQESGGEYGRAGEKYGRVWVAFSLSPPNLDLPLPPHVPSSDRFPSFLPMPLS